MKILSEKKSICTSIKVLYEKGENYFDDIEQKKREGWKAVTRYDSYNDRSEVIIKHSSNGLLLLIQNMTKSKIIKIKPNMYSVVN